MVVLRKGHKESMSITVPEPKDGPIMLWQEGGGKGGIELRERRVHPGGPQAGPIRQRQMARRRSDRAEIRQHRKPSGKSKEGMAPRPLRFDQCAERQVHRRNEEGDVTIHATGKIDGEKMTMNEVRIDSPDSKGVYKKIADVPANYRDMVKQLLANQNTSPVRAWFVIIEKKEER